MIYMTVHSQIILLRDVMFSILFTFGHVEPFREAWSVHRPLQHADDQIQCKESAQWINVSVKHLEASVRFHWGQLKIVLFTCHCDFPWCRGMCIFQSIDPDKLPLPLPAQPQREATAMGKIPEQSLYYIHIYIYTFNNIPWYTKYNISTSSNFNWFQFEVAYFNMVWSRGFKVALAEACRGCCSFADDANGSI